MTYRESRERKAERLRDWGERRQEDSGPMYDAAREEMSRIPLGEPIHSSQDRRRRQKMVDRVQRAFEHGEKGDEMVARADGIERQLRESIYDDDPDAIEQLEAKLAHLEERREKIKAYNAACRKAFKNGDKGPSNVEGENAGLDERLKALDPEDRKDVLTSIQVSSYNIGPGGSAPKWMLSNLGGTISKTRDRLAKLTYERDHGPADRIINARFESDCTACGQPIEKGQTIRYNKRDGARCVECPQRETDDARAA